MNFKILQGKLSDDQEKERTQLKAELEQEMEMLLAYQSKVKKMTDAHHEKETKDLKEKIALQHALVEQKVSLICIELHISCRFNTLFFIHIYIFLT